MVGIILGPRLIFWQRLIHQKLLTDSQYINSKTLGYTAVDTSVCVKIMNKISIYVIWIWLGTILAGCVTASPANEVTVVKISTPTGPAVSTPIYTTSPDTATLTSSVPTVQPTKTVLVTYTPTLAPSCIVTIDLADTQFLAIKPNYSSNRRFAEEIGVWSKDGFSKRNFPMTSSAELYVADLDSFALKRSDHISYPFYLYDSVQDQYQIITANSNDYFLSFTEALAYNAMQGLQPLENLEYIVVGNYIIDIDWQYEIDENSLVILNIENTITGYTNVVTKQYTHLSISDFRNGFVPNPELTKLLVLLSHTRPHFAILDLETGEHFEFELSVPVEGGTKIIWTEAGLSIFFIGDEHLYTYQNLALQQLLEAQVTFTHKEKLPPTTFDSKIQTLIPIRPYVVTNGDIRQIHNLERGTNYAICEADNAEAQLQNPIKFDRNEFVLIDEREYVFYEGLYNGSAGTFILDLATGKYDFIEDYLLIVPLPADTNVDRPIPVVTNTPLPVVDTTALAP